MTNSDEQTEATKKPQMCRQWNLGIVTVGSLQVVDKLYEYDIVPPLYRDDTYSENIEAVTTDTTLELICIKRVTYITALNLPVWETVIPHRLKATDQAKTYGSGSNYHYKTFECPLRR